MSQAKSHVVPELFNCGTLRIDVRLYVPGWYKVTIVGNEILHQTKVEEKDHFHAASEAVHQLWADNAHSIKGEMVRTYGSIPYVTPIPGVTLIKDPWVICPF